MFPKPSRLLRFIGYGFTLCLMESIAIAQQNKTLAFSDSTAVQLSDFGHVRVGYWSCGSDGTSVFTMMRDPEQSEDLSLISVSPKGSQVTYNIGAVPNLPASVIQSIAIDDAGLTVLLAGTPTTSSTSSSSATTFLARFDREGNFIALHPLPKDFFYLKMARLGSQLLILRMAPASGALSLAIFAQGGTFIKTLTPQSEIISTSESKAFAAKHGPNGIATTADAFQMGLAAGAIQMTPVGTKVYIVKSGDLHQLFVVGSDGAVRNVPLKAPDGVDPRAASPNDPLGVTLLSYGPGERDSSLLTFDPTTGQNLGQVTVTGISPVSVICNSSGKYYGVRVNRAGASLLTGSLQ